MKDKQITIPESLFLDIVKLIAIDKPNDELMERVRKGVYDKLDRLVEHELYSQYKTSPTPEQREKARKEYIERKGIPSKFRW